MGSTNRYDGIDAYAVRIIRHKARQLIGHAGFTKSDRDDIEQEMVIDLLRRLPKFDPERAQLNTFIARIVAHKVATLIEAQEAAVRDHRRCTFSLNESLEGKDGETLERAETVDQDDYLLRTGRISIPTLETQETSIDLETFLARLPPELRVLCNRLGNETVAEIVRDTGTPRSTIYEALKKVRRLLEEAGLGD